MYDLTERPPPEREEGECATNDPEFCDRCEAEFRRMAGSLECELDECALTTSKQWGRIWRATARVRNYAGSRFTVRVVCWQDVTSSMLNIGTFPAWTAAPRKR